MRTKNSSDSRGQQTRNESGRSGSSSDSKNQIQVQTVVVVASLAIYLAILMDVLNQQNNESFFVV
ncbi:MAG: hypothetical protein LUD02_09380 [Tannerellaceae bacterium]|nr:hypothetical protein [Tannerellaceae bacterium]